MYGSLEDPKLPRRGVLSINFPQLETHLNHTHCNINEQKGWGSLRPKNALRSTTGVFIESSFNGFL